MVDSSFSFVPIEIMRRLQREPVTFCCWHKIAAYDDGYTIWYDAPAEKFVVRVESSVWDGRSQETTEQTLDDKALLARLTKISSEGQIVSLAWQNMD